MSSSMLPPMSWAAIPAACGLASHIVCHRSPPSSLRAFALVLFFPPIVLTFGYEPFSSVALFRSWVIYLLSLGASITAYRLSPFHPLAGYPGPVLARVSRFWATARVLEGQQHMYYHRLFEQYGEVVRTGPNHLMMRNATAVAVTLSTAKPWVKSARYIVGRPDHSYELISIVDPAEHRARRRLWEPAFVPDAVRSYLPFLHARWSQLAAQLDARVGAPLDLPRWLGFLAADFMGDFAYGSLFDFTLRGEDYLNVHEFGQAGTTALEVVSTVPWVRPLMLALPNPALDKWFATSMGVVEKRRREGGRIRDLAYYLMNEAGEPGRPHLDTETLAREGQLALFAGADTTDSTLSNAFVYLITHPRVLARLRAELDATADDDADDTLREAPYLQAVINEVLRLQPAVPSGVQRLPPAQGGAVAVAGYVVPVGTTVQIPAWSLHRDPRYFSPDPTLFLPERWLPDEGPKLAASRGQEYHHNLTAFIPFSAGPGKCVGRALARLELRTVLAAFVRRYELRFAPGYAAEDWFDNLGDGFTMIRPPLRVVLSRRA